MAKKNDDFFVEKKPWSKVKDELLGCYLKPYVAKILYTRKPLAYVDCFAGKGKFDDGNPGSLLIALDIFRQGLAATRLDGNARIGAAFIDLSYATDVLQDEMIFAAEARELLLPKLMSGEIEV